MAPGTARLDTIAVESLVVLGLGGADTTSAVGDLAALTALTMDGGDADDVLRGGNGADLLIGGNGNDALDGNQGEDRALGGSGNDHFQWDPGDGNDIVEGQAGDDLLDFFGSNGPEIIEVSANGRRVRLTRNLGNITMDIDGVEGAAVHASAAPTRLPSATSPAPASGPSTRTSDVRRHRRRQAGHGDRQRYEQAGAVAGHPLRLGGARRRSARSTRISGSEPLADTLRVQTLDGNDDVTVAPDVSELIAVIADLGAGE